MFLLGCELNIETVKSYIARPVGPVAGMVCQYVCMPGMAYVWGYVFLREFTFARYGLIIVGCCPGGTFSNFYTGRLDSSYFSLTFSMLQPFGMEM